METNFPYARPVGGKQFLGRKEEREKLGQLLSEGKNVVIYEPAKTGKNSLLSKYFSENNRDADVVVLSFNGVRSSEAMAIRLISAIINIHPLSPIERESMINELLPDTCFKYNAEALAKGGSGITVDGQIGDNDLYALFKMPYSYASNNGRKLILAISEFQNILFTDNPDHILRIYETAIKSSGASNSEFSCNWIWTGSQVNAMKSIFEQKRWFYRFTERLVINPISSPVLENYIIKGFLVTGKVMEEYAVKRICTLFKNNIYYLNHFCAICEGICRGYIGENFIQEALSTIISIHEPSFISRMNDLTTFQTQFLKAVLDGETKFSSAEVISKYNLSSSANVHRLKDALCKKEIITFVENDAAVILDPLFEYWLKNFYFTTEDKTFWM